MNYWSNGNINIYTATLRPFTLYVKTDADDFNVNDVATYRQGQRTFELSVAYIGEYDSETILCPKF